MFLVNIIYPEGSIDEDDRQQIGLGIVKSLVGFEDGPQATIRRARAMTHVSFCAANTWTTGDGALLQQDSSPHFHVTVTVPEAWRADISGHAIGSVRSALRRFDRRTKVDRPEASVWVNVVGIDDGSIGMDGSPSTAEDVLLQMTVDYRSGAPSEVSREGQLVDPICGMTVRPGPDAITVEVEGVTVGFCSEGCRDAYASC